MTIIEPAASDESIRFASLESLRFAHSQLLRRFRGTRPTPEMISDVEDFIRRGKATGALLDKDSERWAAQSELDYWATQLYRPDYEPPDAALGEFDPELAPEIADSLCPYVGLDSFHESKQTVFFGRNRLIGELSNELETSRFLAVLGSSGSGKSSLVRAGLIPSLKKGCLPGSENWIYFSPIVPGSNPLANLARLLLPNDSEPDLIEATIIQLRREPDFLVRLVSERFNNPVVLVIDQFEEIFTLCTDEIARISFVDNLIGLCQEANSQHRVIITMRSDFETNVAKIPKLEALFEENVVRITAFNASELREIIEAPAALIGLKFEDGVVDALLNDILGEPAALPLLQFTLLKLWEHRERNRVTWETYKKLGGGRQTLARSADEFYNSLILEEQITMRRILLKMVRPGEGLEITSNRIPRTVLYQKAEANDRIDRVLNKLIKERLVRISEGDTASDEQVEIAHEALVRNWPRLVEWLEEDRVMLRQRQRLTTAAEEWQRLNRATSALWRRELLEEALRYDDLNDLETQFVQASKTRQRRVRTAWVSGMTAIITLLLVAVVVFSLQARTNANLAQQNAEIARTAQAASTAAVAQQMLAMDNAHAAQELAKQALSSRLASQAQLLIETRNSRQTTAVLLAIRSLQLSPSVEAVQILQNNRLASPIATITHDDSINSIDFNPTGQYFVTASYDGSARVWETGTGKEIARVDYNEWAAYAVFDPTRKNVVSAGCDEVDADYNCTISTILVWEALNGKEVTRWVHNGEIRAVNLSPDAHYLVAEGCNLFDNNYNCLLGKTIIWETSTWREIAQLPDDGWKNEIAFSPNGQYISTYVCDTFDVNQNCLEASAHIWALATGSEISHITHEGWINSVAFSPDSQYFATGSSDETARVWEITTGKEIARTTHDGWVNTVTFTPDGVNVVSSGGQTVRIWKAASGEEFAGIVHDHWANSVIVRSDGKYIVSAGCDQIDKNYNCINSTARVLETSTWTEIERLDQAGEIRSVRFSPDGQYLVSAGCEQFDKDGYCVQSMARIWDTSTWEEVAHITQSDDADPVLISPDNKHVVSQNYDDTARVWNITAEKEGILLNHGLYVSSIAYSPDGKYLASGGDQAVRVWEATNGKEIFSVNYERWVESVAFSSNGEYFASSGCNQTDENYNCSQGLMNIFETRTWTTIAQITQEDTFNSVSFSQDERFILSAGCIQLDKESNCTQSMVRIWEVATGNEITHVTQNGSIYVTAFSLDGRYAVSAGCEQVNADDACVQGTAYVWETSTGNEVVRLNHASYVQSIAFSPDGSYIVSGSGDGMARLWEAATGKEIARMTHDGSVNSVSFSPDGRYIVSGSGDGTARVWEATTGKEVSRMTHDNYINAASFSPDGRYVVSGSRDGTARVWESATGKEVTRVLHGDSVSMVSFSPDGNRIASGSFDGTARILMWKVADSITNACSRLTRNLSNTEWKQYMGDEPYQVICPNLPIHPTVIAEKILPTLLDATNGDRIQGAVKIATELLRQNSTSGDINELAITLVKDTIRNEIYNAAYSFDLDSGNIEPSLTLLKDAELINMEIENAFALNNICWFGSIYGRAQDVLLYCEQAVALAVDDEGIRDSRGLARALTGDFEGAISDFQYYVDHSTNEEYVAEREQWIKELEKGNNPFTPEVLEHLKEE